MALVWLAGLKEPDHTDSSKVLVLLIRRAIQIEIQIAAVKEMRENEMRGADPSCPSWFSEACLIDTDTFD